MDLTDKEIVALYKAPKTGLRGLVAFARDNKIPIKRAKEVLVGIESYTLNRQPIHSFQRRRTIVPSPGYQLQCDLADMSRYSKENDGVTFLMCCIDCFSRYAWVFPLKSKAAVNVAPALKELLKETTFSLFQTDNGTEFYNKTVKKVLEENNVTIFSTNSSAKAAIVERFIRTIKDAISHLWVARDSFKYVDVLGDIVDAYNNRYHRSIGMPPDDVNEDNVVDVSARLYPSETKPKSKPKFKEGVLVRTALEKATFGKESTHENWTREIFRIDKLLPTSPPTYKLKDYNGKEILRSYYERELQKVREPIGDVYKVEKVLKYRTNKGKREAFVRWLGYGEEFDSWIAAGDLKKI
jgi:transposase InsO family protein